ncbi:MAG: 23S rRNA (uracil(1939)-C(5))-methyltransferase RlmD [Bacteroidales bacterium]|nr:23S rRNA (uracil(1939)-C(5))-methyltransferase RlmD [Bacteroidales bacterium]
MARGKKPLLEKVEITAIGSEGKALGRVDDKVVFVPMLVPGDVVDVQVTRKRKNYMEGYVVKQHKFSEMRQDPVCSHFGVCGGCKWQHLPYEKQLEFKQQVVIDNFTRIGKFEFPGIRPIIGSEYEYYYRNKLEYTFSNRRWLTEEEIGSGDSTSGRNALGFHVPGMFDRVVDIEKCYLQNDISNKIRNSIREYAIRNKLDFYDSREHRGYLRTMVVRTSSTGERMVILNLAYENRVKSDGLLSFIRNSFPEITSLMYVINDKRNDTFYDLEVILYAGRDHIIEKMGDLKFRVGPKSFFQTNTLQSEKLYSVALDFANLKGDEIVYDLYTGTGSIANYVAGKSKKVIGLEYVHEAIEDAGMNSRINEIANTEFFSGDIKDLLKTEFIDTHGRPDVIITDPPRAGMHESVLKTIMEAGADRIVYVSCNPATQARDIAILAEKYEVAAVQPVDMFPQTHHVENVVLLRRKTKVEE